MKVGDRVVFEYTLANTHYLPGRVTEITPGERIATVKLDAMPDFLITDVVRVETKHLFARFRPL